MRLTVGTTSVAFDLDRGGRLASLAIDGLELLVQPVDLMPDVVSAGSATDEPRLADREGLADPECLVDPERFAETKPLDEPSPMAWGSYPMVPWAGRVRNGVFRFDGHDVQLPLGLPPHAIHGTGYLQSWEHGTRPSSRAAAPTPQETLPQLAQPQPAQPQPAQRQTAQPQPAQPQPAQPGAAIQEAAQPAIKDVDSAAASMWVDLDEAWPFGGFAVQRAVLKSNSLTLSQSVTATESAMPVMVGWHPWFRRSLQAGAPLAQLRWEPGRMYELSGDDIPTGDLATVSAGPWDNCFVELASDPQIIWPGQIELTLSSDCEYWVVYTEPTHALCVEPQSDAPDSFNRTPDRIEPGETFTRTFTLRW